MARGRESFSAHRLSLAVFAEDEPLHPRNMTVTVLLFASYADALGRPSIELALPVGATVSDALRHVGELPGAGEVPPSPLVAVNERYARLDQVLAAGDELAIIPPVSGG